MKLIGICSIIFTLCCAGKASFLQKRGEPPVLTKIAEMDECQTEIKNFCKEKKSNNFELLTCLHDNVPDHAKLSEPCQHIIWQSKNNLTKAVSFFINGISAQSCESDIEKIADCKLESEANGPVMPCLLEYRDKVKNPTCKKYLDFLKPLIFSDYRLTYKLVDMCSEEIKNFQCGRIANYMKVSDQGSTIDCLAESYENLGKDCKHEILKISELQSDDWNNDRPLFLACREDRERICPQVPSGSGLVYECLFKNKLNPEMSLKCAEKLRLRQKLQQNDFSVDYRFASACSSDIKRHKCDISDGDAADYVHANLSNIILCLEEAKLEGLLVAPECIAEVKRLRFSLLEDHKINPEVVTQCKEEIKLCEEEQGRQPFVIHCLMEIARANNAPGKKSDKSSSSKSCFDAVENLLMNVNVGDDYEVDPALLNDCNAEINKLCVNVKKGEGRVMDCLMSHIDQRSALNEKCLDRLMEVQYFLSRNFKVSRKLVVRCKQDAKKICSVDLNNIDPSEDSHLISCLYRNRPKVAPNCVGELRKLMTNRARSIDLPPAIQESCMNDLVTLCSDKLDRDEEMFCLEDNYDSLSKSCQKKVSAEVDQQENLSTLGRIFSDSCQKFSKEICENLSEDDEQNGPESLMKCLISNKNHPEIPKKCKAGITHHQLMLMKEVKLSYAFILACNPDLDEYCRPAKKKLEMVRCLSEHVYNDSMLNNMHRIGNKCRKELNFELLQIGENIGLDGELQEACQKDRKQFCDAMEAGDGEIIECLRKHQNKLQLKCRELLFKRKLMEAVDSSVDYTLITKCKSMIKKHCKEELSDIFGCLKQHRNDDGFDEQCHFVVINRMRLRSEDIRLNPVLFKNCNKDISKYCQNELEEANRKNVEVEGLVIRCLRRTFIHKLQSLHMSTTCKDHVTELIKDSAIDYLQDAALVKACKDVIVKKCLKEAERHKLDEDGGEIQECLRDALLSDEEVRDHNTQCFVEIQRRIMENNVDIQIDPILHRVCKMDALSICKEIRRGEGRVMSCLLDAMPDPNIPMNSECRKSLKDRSELWALSVKIAPPDSLGELYQHVQSSTSKLYFQLILFISVCLIFFGGLYCGRLTKRQQMLKKR